MHSAATGAKVLAYDGDCRMCTAFSRLAERRWLVGEATRRPVDAFEGEDLARLYDAGVHNEMAVMDPTTQEIRTGYDGLLWLLRSGRFGWMTPLVARGPLAWLGRHAYRTIAYNRRVLSPPEAASAAGGVCACDPDLHRGYRWTLIIFCVLWMALAGSLTTFLLLDGEAWAGLGLALSWLILSPLAVGLPSPLGIAYLGHMALTGARMALPSLAGSLAFGMLDSTDPARLGLIVLLLTWGLALPLAARARVRHLPLVRVSGLRAAAVTLTLWFLPLAFAWSIVRSGQPPG